MSNVIPLPLLAPDIREGADARKMERSAGRLLRLLPRRTTASVPTAAAARHFGSPRRLEGNNRDRSLIAATNALLADRRPRGRHLPPGDAIALRVAIALRTLHPGGRTPTPHYVDDLARRVRILQRREARPITRATLSPAGTDEHGVHPRYVAGVVAHPLAPAPLNVEVPWSFRSTQLSVTM
jgi:hypothetical protein